MQLLLSAMRIKGVQLVDNRDFLEYMRTQVNNLTLGAYGFGGEELSLDAGDLTEDLKEQLLSSYGASSLETVEQLQEALSGLFWYRGYQFEAIAVFDVIPPPPLDSCSITTEDVAWDVYNNNLDGISLSLDESNLKPFYQFVLNWIMDQ